jgi:16S rRNA processing protein RimM
VGEEDPSPMPVQRARLHQGVIILKLEGCDTRNQAEALRNQWLQVRLEEALTLDEGEFFYYQLIGLQVETVDGEVLGELHEILQTGANDVFVVRGPGGELLLPDIPDVILEIDPEAGRIVVQIPAGLRDE